MRIGFSSFVLQGGKTGIASYITQLLQGLYRVGGLEACEVFLPADERALLEGVVPSASLCSSLSLVKHPLINIAWHNTLLPLLVQKRALDVVHVPTIRRIPLIKGAPVVATIHDMAPFALEGKYDPLRTAYHKWVLPTLVKRCDHIITVSEYTKRDIQRYTGVAGERISVIYSGIDGETFSMGDPELSRQALKEAHGVDGPFIVYVARIEHPAKNHLRLIEAFERLRLSEHRPLQLILAGADWHGAQEVKAAAAKSPFASDIHFLGFVPRSSIVHLYRCCELMVFPSLFEGFGFPLLEAMACGAPVACSDSSSLTELGQGHCPLFDPHEADSIVEGMVQGLALKAQAGYQQEAIKFASRFHWDEAAKQTRDVYRSVL